MNGVDPKLLKPGMQVLYHSWEKALGKVHIIDSEPWELHPNQWVVKLKGKSGCVGVDFISEILED